MIHRHTDRHLPVLACVGRRHSGPPHRLDPLRDDGPIVGFGAMRMALPRGGQQLVSPPQAHHPARRRAETAMPQPGPDLAVPFAGEGRCLQDAPNRGHQLVIRTGAKGAPSGSPCRARVPLPGDGGACQAPHAAAPRQAIRLARGGRGGLAHRRDLLGGKGRLVSSRPIFSRNSSMSMVDSPRFCRKRARSRSWSSSDGFVSASWPASRNASRHIVRRAAGMPSSRDTRARASPRRRRRTPSVFCRAENRRSFCHPLLLPSPVALRAPGEGTSMETSCACLWTPPLSDYTQCSVQ
jgi:hypothetical protein